MRDLIPNSTRQPILVSACLLGICTAYDGQGRAVPALVRLSAEGRVVPVCPEVAGGLPIPRAPAEIQGGDGADVLDGRARVVDVEGRDVTEAYLAGAQHVLRVARRLCALCGPWGEEVCYPTAILKSRSPSCGCGQIHDGSFSGVLVPGDGVTAALLRRNGIAVGDETWIPEE